MKVKAITEREIALFEKKLVRAEKSANTIQKYVRDVRKLQKFAEGKRLNKALVLDFKKQLAENENYKASSINSFLTAVNRFFILMNWNDLIVKTIKIQRAAFESEQRELTMQEYKKMVYTAIEQGETTTALLLQTIAGTGIRVGELCHISVDCLENGVVDVYNKGKVRRILLPTALQKLLKDYVCKKEITHGSIFQNRKQQPIDRREVWRRMKFIATTANVPVSKAFPHNLRHLFARQFYNQTRDIAKLADVLGHSSIDTTRIYVKSTGREHKKLLDQMNLVHGSDPGVKEAEIKENALVFVEKQDSLIENIPHSEKKNYIPHNNILISGIWQPEMEKLCGAGGSYCLRQAELLHCYEMDLWRQWLLQKDLISVHKGNRAVNGMLCRVWNSGPLLTEIYRIT